MDKKPKKRIHCFFSGLVQGVGFRYTVHSLAHTLGVTGWVRNLPDGRVELVGESSEATLLQLLKAIQNSGPGSYVRNVDVKWLLATGDFNEFSIEF
jgi:acylphosphatase